MHALMLVLKTADIQDYRITGLQELQSICFVVFLLIFSSPLYIQKLKGVFAKNERGIGLMR